MTTASAELLACCPFCGETPDVNKRETFTLEDQPKWASVNCCITGPEIRTGYEKWPAWKQDAIAAWNTRAVPPAADAGCADCGMLYSDDGWADFVVSHDVWAKLTVDSAGLLCANCMVRRARRLGIGAEGRFTSGPFCADLTPAADADVEGVADDLADLATYRPFYEFCSSYADTVMKASSLLSRLAAERATPPVASNSAAVAAEREALDTAWARINALGSPDTAEDPDDQLAKGVNQAVDAALRIIDEIRDGKVDGDESLLRIGRANTLRILAERQLEEALATVHSLINDLHGSIDRQTMDEKLPDRVPDDYEYNVNVTFKQERDLAKAVLFIEQQQRARSAAQRGK